MKTAALAGMAVVVLVALWRVDPSTSAVFPPCLFRAFTGWQCPGCGSARALHALLHGHWVDALRLNPLAVAALPLAVAECLYNAGGGRPSLLSRLGSRSTLAIAAAVILFGVARNV
jgi:hypothetical protein